MAEVLSMLLFGIAWNWNQVSRGNERNSRFADGLLARHIVSTFKPTTGNNGKGNPLHWWKGVERLREQFNPTLDCEPLPGDYKCSVYRTDGELLLHETHANPAIAVLRAACCVLA